MVGVSSTLYSSGKLHSAAPTKWINASSQILEAITTADVKVVINNVKQILEKICAAEWIL